MSCTLYIILTVFTGYHIVLWSGLATLKVAIFVMKMLRKTIFFKSENFSKSKKKVRKNYNCFIFQLPQGCEEYK